MGLSLRPHTIRLYAGEQYTRPDRRTAEALTHPGAGVEVLGKIEPLAPGTAFEAFGVEVERPHRLMLDPDDGEGLAVNDRVTWGARAFRVRAVRVFDSFPDTAHVTALLDEEAL